MSVIHWGFELKREYENTRKCCNIGVAAGKGGWYPEAAMMRRSGCGEMVKVGEIPSKRG